jgi:hypothetical protein
MDDMNTKQMNPTKERNGDLCEIAMHCCSKGSSSLSNFPGLMKEIIETKAWERREWRGKVFELPSLLDLITRKPLEGWGEDPEKVEALIESDPEVLSMWRKETTRANHRPLKSNDNIITSSKAKQGTGKAYTLDRLSKENPDLYQSVVNGELSANAAAIAAGWRKKTVTVTDDPASAAKTLREKFGDEWFKAMVQEAGMELDPVKAKAPKVKPQAKRVKEKVEVNQQSVGAPRPEPSKAPEKKSPRITSWSYNILYGYFTNSRKSKQRIDNLEKSLQKEGCKSPIIIKTRDGKSPCIIDGEERKKICEKLGIHYQIQEMYFESDAHVLVFIAKNEISELEAIGDKAELKKYHQHLKDSCKETRTDHKLFMEYVSK